MNEMSSLVPLVHTRVNVIVRKAQKDVGKNSALNSIFFYQKCPTHSYLVEKTFWFWSEAQYFFKIQMKCGVKNVNVTLTRPTS